MQNYVVAFFFLILTLAFAGCTRQMPATSTNTQSTETTTTSKVGQTTKTGKIVELNGKLFLQVTGQQPLDIDSYNVDLKSNVGKTVTVTGEYSGNTLFVGKLQ